MISSSFDCPVAKTTVTVSTSTQIVRAGFPPVQRFHGCSGCSTCGVEQRHSDGASYNWDICPIYNSLPH